MNIRRKPQLAPKFGPKTAGAYQAAASNTTNVNTSFPGQNAGIPRNLVIEETINAAKCIGTSYQTANGATVSPAISLPATARKILGFSFTGNFTAGNSDTFDLRINNEVVAENASVEAFTVRNGRPSHVGYYPFERFVAGSTSVQIAHTSNNAAVDVVLTIFYI